MKNPTPYIYIRLSRQAISAALGVVKCKCGQTAQRFSIAGFQCVECHKKFIVLKELYRLAQAPSPVS